jgi:chromate transporter
MEALQIILTFLKIGLVSFGGGWSTVGILRHEVVPRWMDEDQFRSLIAIAQSTPGPVALNAATMIGWNRGGLLIAAAATLSVVAVPVLLIVLAVKLAERVAIEQPSLDESLKTTSLAMLLMTLWALRPTSPDPLLLFYAAATFAISAFTKVNALWAILGAGAVNALFGPVLRSLLGL